MKKKAQTKKRVRTVIPIDFKPEIKEQVERLAEAEGIGTSTYIRRIIHLHLSNKKRVVGR